MTSRVFVALRVPADPAHIRGIHPRDCLLVAAGPSHSDHTHGDGELGFEPGPGGRLISRLANGETYEIGRVSVWEPGRRLVFGWRQASFSPEQSTEVEVLFEPVGEEARVSIEHRAWDTIPQRHVARHGFPEHVTLRRVAAWAGLAGRAAGASAPARTLSLARGPLHEHEGAERRAPTHSTADLHRHVKRAQQTLPAGCKYEPDERRRQQPTRPCDCGIETRCHTGITRRDSAQHGRCKWRHCGGKPESHDGNGR